MRGLIALIPALRRFYGGTAHEWLTMQGDLLEVHTQELTRLRAREALHDATVAALGSGRMKPRDAGRIQRAWTREAGLARAQKIQNKDQLKAILGAAGIGVRG